MVDVIIPTSTEWGTTILSLYEAYYGKDELDKGKDHCTTKPTARQQECNLRALVPLLRRNSICVTGRHRESLQDVKLKIQSLQDEPIALESFHVKQPSDITDGAFLAPKIVLVGIHSPGCKILDDEEDEGQLDFLYDEALRLGADIMVLYVGLPRRVYPPMRSAYHPKIAESIFPQQRLIKRLASDNCFMTVSEGCDLNNIQKNMLREWLGMPSHMEDYLLSAGEEEKILFELKTETAKPAPTVKTEREAPEARKKKKLHKVKKDPSKRKRKLKYTFEKDEDIEEEQLVPDVELNMYRSVPMPADSPGGYGYEQL